MGSPAKNEYAPDAVSPPGETLADTLEALGMTQAELAERTGRTKKLINEIVQGKATITPQTALQFERALGVPARFWNRREQHYREYLARTEERLRLEPHVDWVSEFPIRTMCQLSWIRCWTDPVDQVRELLSFFGAASPELVRGPWLSPGTAEFRQSPAFEANPWAVAAWLRKGHLEAQQLSCAPYNAARFRATLKQIRALTLQPAKIFQPEVVRLCAECGVAVVFVPELPKIRASGATRWLTKDKAMIQLSLRYKSDDHLWFTFFHEAGHILLHGRRDVFVETGNRTAKDEKEKQANQFAADMLIPRQAWRKFSGRARYSKNEISAFAQKIGIAPGIVVGRLQHEGDLDFKYCNDLKRRLMWLHELDS